MRTPLFTLLLFLFSLINTTPLQAQEKRLEFNLGFGPALDAIHAGINFQIKREIDIGFSVGTIPNGFDLNDHINIGFESKYKFGDSQTFKTRIEKDGRLRNMRLKTWYAGLRGNFVKNIKSLNTEKRYIYLTPTIGRHCYFSKSFGLNIDLGLSLTAKQSTLYSGNNICRNCFFEENPQYPLLPTLRVQFFAKI